MPRIQPHGLQAYSFGSNNILLISVSHKDDLIRSQLALYQCVTKNLGVRFDKSDIRRDRNRIKIDQDIRCLELCFQLAS
jgi:hypothetical protein